MHVQCRRQVGDVHRRAGGDDDEGTELREGDGAEVGDRASSDAEKRPGRREQRIPELRACRVLVRHRDQCRSAGIRPVAVTPEA